MFSRNGVSFGKRNCCLYWSLKKLPLYWKGIHFEKKLSSSIETRRILTSVARPALIGSVYGGIWVLLNDTNTWEVKIQECLGFETSTPIIQCFYLFSNFKLNIYRDCWVYDLKKPSKRHQSWFLLSSSNKVSFWGQIANNCQMDIFDHVSNPDHHISIPIVCQMKNDDLRQFVYTVSFHRSLHGGVLFDKDYLKSFVYVP